MTNFVYSLIRFVIAIFFILLGICGFIIPWSSTFRNNLIQFILEDPVTISIFGFVFILIGSLIVVNIILNSQQRYYTIRSGHQSVLVNKLIIEQYVQSYWQNLFPNRDIPSHIILKKNKINITADLPYLPQNEQKELLEKIKNDLEAIFKQILGPDNQFRLAISFQKAAKEKAVKAIAE